MIEKEILQEIIEWLGNDTSYLSQGQTMPEAIKTGSNKQKGLLKVSSPGTPRIY